MEPGFLRFDRGLVGSEVWNNPILLKLLIFCRYRANFQDTKVTFPGDKPIQVLKGQFLTGRKSLCKELFAGEKNPPHETTVWRALERLETIGYIKLGLRRDVRTPVTVVTVCGLEACDEPKNASAQGLAHSIRSSDADALMSNTLKRSDRSARGKIISSQPGQKVFAFVSVGDASPYAEEIFTAARYSGEDGSVFWRASACWHAGLFQEGHVIPSAVAARELGRNKPAYFRSCLAERLEGTPERLDGILKSVRITPYLPKKPPTYE